jgi:hypothetical protein
MLSNSSYHKKQQDYKKKPLVSTYRPSSNPSTPPSPYLHEDNTLLLKKPTESTGVISELTQIRSIPYLTLWIVLIIIIVITGVTLFIVYYYPTGANKITLGSSSSSTGSSNTNNSSTGS